MDETDDDPERDPSKPNAGRPEKASPSANLADTTEAEVDTTGAEVPPPLRRARAIAHVMDDLVPIPGTPWRVGLDPLLGLVPAAGDWATWVIAFYLVVGAAQLGAGAPLLARMLGNIVVDAVMGVVPVLGDLFDVAWKANDRNLTLLEAHVAHPERTARRSVLLVGGLLAGGVGILAAGAWAVWWLLAQTAGLVF